MKSNYQTDRPRPEKGRVPTLALKEFESRIAKVRNRFKGELESNQGLLASLQTQVAEQRTILDELHKEVDRIVGAAQLRAQGIISEADGIRHATLLDVEMIRQRAEAYKDSARQDLLSAGQKLSDVSRREVQVEQAEARVRNHIKELEHLRTLDEQAKKTLARAAEHEAAALAAEARANQIWAKDKETLFEISATLRTIKQAPFYAAKNKRR